MELFIWAQIVGFIALVLEVARFQFKSSKLFFVIDPFISLLYAAQFYLLGTSAYLMSLISFTRGLSGAFLTQKQIVPIIILFHIPVYIFVGGINVEYWYDVLPVVAILCSTFAFLERDNSWLVRRLYIGCYFSWMVFSSIVGAYVYIICCLLALFSILVAICRYEEKYQNIFSQLLSWSSKKSPA